MRRMCRQIMVPSRKLGSNGEKMKSLALLVMVTVIALASLTERPASAGYGNCYEARPSCIFPAKPLCICGETNQCAWMCVREWSP